MFVKKRPCADLTHIFQLRACFAFRGRRVDSSSAALLVGQPCYPSEVCRRAYSRGESVDRTARVHSGRGPRGHHKLFRRRVRWRLPCAAQQPQDRCRREGKHGENEVRAGAALGRSCVLQPCGSGGKMVVTGDETRLINPRSFDRGPRRLQCSLPGERWNPGWMAALDFTMVLQILMA